MNESPKGHKAAFCIEMDEIYPGVSINEGHKIRLRNVLISEVSRIQEEIKLRQNRCGYGWFIRKLGKEMSLIRIISVSGFLLALCAACLSAYVMIKM
ncbi:MAG: hypothetical protein K1W05_09350 [Desulfovibrio sp.]